MNPELLTLIALTSDPSTDSDKGRDLVEWSEQYGLEASSVLTPKIAAENCSADLGEYPAVHLMWPNQGPAVDLQEEAILVGERNGETGEVYPSGLLQDFEIETEVFNRQVDIVLAVDGSGSMTDNAGLTQQIIAQVERHYPDARVNAETIYYTEAGVNGARQSNYGYLGYGYASEREEDHVGALTEGLRILKMKDGPAHKQHVILVTDEGDKRSSGQERSAVAAKARAQGVQVHLVYDGPEQLKKPVQKPATPEFRGVLYARSYSPAPTLRASRMTEDFTSLMTVARSTGGEVRRMQSGKVPNIFRTEIAKADYSSIAVVPQDPYQTGMREFVVANGEGARCVVDIPASVIERAILEGSLPEPTIVETPDPEAESAFSFNLPKFTLRDGLMLAIGGIAGSFATWFNQKKKKDVSQ